MAQPTNQPTQHQPAHAPTGHVEEFAELLKRFGPSIATGLIIGLLVYTGLMVYRSYQIDVSERASLALMMAQDAPSFQAVLDQFEDSNAAPSALLGVGASHFADGRYDEAYAAYADFEARFPDHPMAPAARLCKFQCQVANGQLEEALGGLAAFTASQPGGYLRPYAMMGQARCLEQLDRWNEARTIYEEMIAEFPETVWGQQGEIHLDRVRRTLRAGT